VSERGRIAYASHEAGHTVAAFFCDWRVTSIEINAAQHINYVQPAEVTAAAECLVSLAGWLADHRVHGIGRRWRWPTYVQEIVAAVLSGDLSAYSDEGVDDAHAVAALAAARPGASPAALLRAFRRAEREAWRFVGQHRVWRLIEMVAAALLAAGTLSGDEVYGS
jgi:hypothetical protein